MCTNVATIVKLDAIMHARIHVILFAIIHALDYVKVNALDLPKVVILRCRVWDVLVHA